MADFIERIKEHPCYLMLGQSYLQQETQKDYFLSQILKKYSIEKEKETSYHDIFNTNIAQDQKSALSWMLGRCQHIPIPSELETISKFSWSGVFTSAFDDIIDRSFRSEYRTVQAISDDKYRPNEPRSRKKLHIWHLFGALTATDENGKPPLKIQEYWQRQAVATILLNKLPELITPFGTLVIEGYDNNKDWLKPNLIFPIINALSIGQVHMFSVLDIERFDETLHDLIKHEKLVIHQESLAQYLLNAEKIGTIKLGEIEEEIDLAHSISIQSKHFVIPPQLWTQINSTANIIPDSNFLPIKPISDDMYYSEFRDFLYESSFCPPWIGYTRGFAFRRDFEYDLKNIIVKRLRTPQGRNNVFILHGQTGSGKTVALGRLAYEIQEQGVYPVIFISRSMNRINKESIDSFCEWTEENGASVTLIIWDAMQLPYEYNELLHFLQSRGRKILLIGSSYKLEKQKFKGKDYYYAPAELSDDPQSAKTEIERFTEYLCNIDSNIGEKVSQHIRKSQRSFLGFLYRLLPPTRTSLVIGIDRELTFVEANIFSKMQNATLRDEAKTLMCFLLEKAGFINKKTFQNNRITIGGEEITQLRELTGMIMVPGQFNIRCPFDLLLRAVGTSYSDSFLDTLRSVDFFRWIEDYSGNYSIGPRTAFEAELIVRHRIGGAKFEAEYAMKLLSAIRLDSMFEKQEVQFAIDLIQSIGPNGRRAVYYESYFVDLAKCLEHIRTSYGITNPRLMLQESLLFRESAKKETDHDIKSTHLIKAEQVALQAIKALEHSKNKQLLSRIRVELGSTYAQRAKLAKNTSNKLYFADLAHKQCIYAHINDPQNFHPIDVISWTVRDLLSQPSLQENERISLIEIIMHAFNVADVEGYTGANLEQLNVRKMEIYEIINKNVLSDDAFDLLIEQGSARGIYIKAYKNIYIFLKEGDLSVNALDAYNQSLQFLSEYKSIVEHDSKALLLQLRLWWICKAKVDFYSSERTCLPFSYDDWIYCNSMLSKLLSFSDFVDNMKLQYIQGICYYHLRDFNKGELIFKELEIDTQYYGRRVIKHYLWSNPDGTPALFNGTVAYVYKNGRGEIQVNEIQRRIPFLAHDTSKNIVNRGDNLNNFRIAFNMRGPIADFRV